MNLLKNKKINNPIDMEEVLGFTHKGITYVHYSKLPQHESAFHNLTLPQKVFLSILAVFLVTSFIVNFHLSAIVFITFLTLLYFLDLLFNLFLVQRSFSKSHEIEFTQDELDSSNFSWPKYTIFCPLYKEWRVLSQFVTAMEKLDYPKDKLQIMLLLEEDDTKTISKIKNYNLPAYFEVVIVPHSKPKTKPKAVNYGLIKATGDYVVIFDAEDVPEVDQLKKAVIAFEKADPNVKCIQAKLNFYNPKQNILTRLFTAEYSLWFDLVLTGLQSINAPIPLGGTSNHFRKKDIISLNGWDSFNVTEDADLGMRIAKRKFKTALISSTTYEEANSDLKNWFWQRTRWIKGYMQTYLVHMRKPNEFTTKLTQPDSLTFQLVIGGKIASMFVNPLMWGLTIMYFVTKQAFGAAIESLFLDPIFYLAVISLVLGNFLYTYYYMMGLAKRGYFEIIKYMPLIPLYWLLMSAAAWYSVFLLIKAPHHWSKTKHGLHLKRAISKKTVQGRFNIPKITLIPQI